MRLFCLSYLEACLYSIKPFACSWKKRRLVKKNLIFDRNKNDIFLNDLKNNLLPLSSIDNIEDLYHNFTTTLSHYINKFSIEVSINKRNRKTNSWYDQDCKSARREIKESLDESLKIDKIKIYKALTKRKNCNIFIKYKKISYTSLRWILRNYGGKF